jgi:large subunit ribosomal protein L5
VDDPSSHNENVVLSVKHRGMDIAITTTAQNNEDAKKLLAMFNFPFKDKENG